MMVDLMSQTRVAPENFRNPIWDEAGRVHDWRNYASEWLREVWTTLSDEQARAIAASLDDIAMLEDWD